MFPLIQTLRFPFLQYTSVCGEASYKYKLVIVEHRGAMLYIMATSTYSDYFKHIMHATKFG